MIRKPKSTQRKNQYKSNKLNWINYEMDRGLDVLEENGGALILGNLVPMMLLNVLHLETVVSIVPAAHLSRRNLTNTP